MCVTQILSKYAWVIPLKYKSGIAVTNVFQKNSDKFNCKPKKIWIDKGSEFYNRSKKSRLEKYNIDMYLTQNEGKCVVAERFIRSLKNKIYKCMTSISKMIN